MKGEKDKVMLIELFETIFMKVSMRKFISQKKKKSLSSGFKG